MGGGNTPLQISVNESFITKATGQTSGTSLASGAEIGVFVTTSDGASYDAKDYSNIKYTATGEGVGQTWAFDENTPVMLSSTKGKAYAYYPRQASGVSLNSITISNDGNDWMYTPTASSEVSVLNPTANLSMEHAMTIIRVKVVAANAESDGTISSLTLDGTGWATSATLNLQNGTIGSYVGEGASLVANDLGALNTTGVSRDFWVVSNKTASSIAFKVNVGSNMFLVYTPTEVTLDRGKVYNYTLKVETKKGAELSSVSLTDWTSEDNVDADVYVPMTWEEAKARNGVYAIDIYGNPVDYSTASAGATGTYKGVALVMDGKAIEIALEDASSSTTWAATNPMSETETAVFSAYYITSPTTVRVDMEGKANTERILNANVTIASVINDYNTSKGSTSWYLPSLGQLYNIYINGKQINDLLTKVSGTKMSTGIYWSSSVYSASAAWHVYFFNSFVNYYNVTNACWVRLVRDL